MTPVSQLIQHEQSGDIVQSWGDCFRASLASLLDMRPEDVPHFCDGPPPTDGPDLWHQQVNSWLAQFDLFWMEFGVSEDGGEAWRQSLRNYDAAIYHLISGKSPRPHGRGHTVVGLNGIVVHDPHPSRDGILHHDAYGFIFKRCGALL